MQSNPENVSNPRLPDLHEQLVRHMDAAVAAIAPEVAEAEQAAREEQAAQAALLAAAIARVRSLLPRICGRVAREWHGTTADGLRGVERTEFFERRGVCLAGTYGDDVGGRDDTSGDVEGEAVVLWADGSLSIVHTSGRWSRYMRDVPFLAREETPVTTAEVVEQWPLTPMLQRLVDAISALATGSHAQLARTARARADALRAATEVIERPAPRRAATA